MNLKSFHKRFKDVRDSQFPKSSFLQKAYFYIDWLSAFVIHGASINDYFVYGMYFQKHNGRERWITYRKYKKYMNLCNPFADKIQLCRNKLSFNNKFDALLGRKWIDVTSSSTEDLDKFLKSIPSSDSLFLKEVLGFRGSSVIKITPENRSLDYIYSITKKDPKGYYILEEAIKQSGMIHDFHPWSVNTIRIVTIYDDKKDKVHFMDASLRVGNNKNHVDNLHYEGIAWGIDINTGIIYAPGFDRWNNKYLTHPITGLQIIGYQIPEWEKIKNFVKNAARKLPEVRYVGWDIVPKGNGDLCLIEANDNADHDIQQIPRGPLWKEYKDVLKNLK